MYFQKPKSILTQYVAKSVTNDTVYRFSVRLFHGFHAYAEMSKKLVCFAFIMDSVLVGVIIHYMDLLMECWVHMPQKSPFP